jgi:hypothetical protein
MCILKDSRFKVFLTNGFYYYWFFNYSYQLVNLANGQNGNQNDF